MQAYYIKALETGAFWEREMINDKSEIHLTTELDLNQAVLNYVNEEMTRMGQYFDLVNARTSKSKNYAYVITVCPHKKKTGNSGS